jgi:hypothetical protein
MHAKLGKMACALQILTTAADDEIIDCIQAHPCMWASVTKGMYLIVFYQQDNRVIRVIYQDIKGLHRLFHQILGFT